MKRRVYTKNQIEEAKFHDKWSNSVTIEKIDIEKYFLAEASFDYRLAMELLGEIKNKTLLDLGCGLGETAVYFALNKARVKALDISPGMLECVKKLGNRYQVSRRIKLIESATEKIPLPNGSVDLVFGGNILHHVNITKTSKEIRRVLKKGGKAVFIEPLGYNPVIHIYRFIAKDIRTKMESPFTFREIKMLGCNFKSVCHIEKQLVTTLIFVWFFLVERVNPRKVRYWKKIIEENDKYGKAFKILEKIDRIVLRLPLIKRLCWNTVIELVK